MPTNLREDDALDNEPTDELPILLETAVLDPAMVSAAIAPRDFVAVEEATGEHTVLYPVMADEERADLVALRSDLEARAAKIQALEADIRRLSGRWLDVERHLNEKEAVIEQLTTTLATSKQALQEHEAAERRLSTEIADRESQFNRLLDELDRQRRQNASQQVELDGQRRRLEEIETELRGARDQVAEHLAKPSPVAGDDRLQALQQEVATLTGYIANRRSHWDELEVGAVSAAARIGELERELAHRAARQRIAEQLAQSEMARAESFRRELVEMSRAVETRDQEIATLRAAHGEPKANVERLRAQLEQSNQLNLRLQAELEHRRAHIDKQAEELRAKDRQLDVVADDLDQVRRQFTETRAQLEENRADIAGLERALLDKDHSLDSRNERIATLQQELDQKLGALQKLNAMDLSLQGLDSKMSERLKSTDSAEQANNTPALLCLTSDSPQRYALSKSTMTIGRSSRCDIQIFTHFVSREHAKLTIERSRVVIEDLGSTNGVFVNAVRVDRQELQHSDLVTVGETQFRFLERMAH